MQAVHGSELRGHRALITETVFENRFIVQERRLGEIEVEAHCRGSWRARCPARR